MSARPTTVRKTYAINLPRPRDLTDPNFIEILKQLEADIQAEFEFDKNYVDEQIGFNDLLITQL
jgi:ABC-type nitrate/sulfonate/bicarbonate transport system ATPase subunit